MAVSEQTYRGQVDKYIIRHSLNIAFAIIISLGQDPEILSRTIQDQLDNFMNTDGNIYLLNEKRTSLFVYNPRLEESQRLFKLEGESYLFLPPIKEALAKIKVPTL